MNVFKFAVDPYLFPARGRKRNQIAAIRPGKLKHG